MPQKRIDLPPTLAECHQLILELYDTIDELRARVARLERELYGHRRERFLDDAEQFDDSVGDLSGLPDPPGLPPGVEVPEFFDPTASTQVGDERAASLFQNEQAIPTENPAAAAAFSDDAEAPPRKPKRSTKGRRPRSFPPHIPRVFLCHRLDESQVPAEILHNPQARRFFRYVRHELDVPPPTPRVLLHFQEVIALDDTDRVATMMHTAPMPEPVLERCYAGSSLLAFLAVSRFSDHLPYYRVEDVLRRHDVMIHRATQWRWMRRLAGVLEPLVDLIRQRLRTCLVLGIDETPCPIIDPGLPHTRSAYLYAQHGDDSQPYVGYYFADHKSRENIEPMLDGFSGVLQSDAYICYELIAAASLNRILPAACWAHGRRKFEPLVIPGRRTKASWILKEVQKLYDIEDRARLMTPEDRLALRQAESRQIVEAIYHFLLQIQLDERPRSEIRKAANYFLNRWDSFTRFLTNGLIGIDNNSTEASIKGIATGKKAWLFLGNQAAGETAASMYTLIMSCKRLNIDPHAYLLDVLQHVKTARGEALEALLPDRWIQAHPEAVVEQRVQESAAAAYRKRTRRQARRRQLTGS